MITQRDFFDKEISNKAHLSQYYIVENNDFIYNPRVSNFAPVGPIKRNKLGRTGIMSPLYYVFRIRKIDYSFLEYFFETTKWHTFMRLNGDNGARSDRFSIKDEIFSEMPIALPSIDEQIKIGSFFKQLDETIALHKRKLAKLLILKLAFLNSIFCIRNIQFYTLNTISWEQRKLGEEKDVRDGTHSSPSYYSYGYPLITSKNLSDNGLDFNDMSYISESDYVEINKRSKVDIGDILLGLIGTIGKPVLVNQDGYAIKNIGLIKRGGEINNTFILYDLQSSSFNSYIEQKNTGNTQKFLGLDTLRNYKLYVPSKEEQTQIGSFFKQLDETIALHKRKQRKYQQIKQIFLNKMLVD